MVRRTGGPRLGWLAVAALSAAALTAGGAYGAERMVLGEYFNATW
jgi:hypothetical protein